jgi:predicted alpha/beta hydrolase family esterase
MTTTLIVPGLHSSGPNHWQTWFEERIPGSVRVIQRDWTDANLAEWSSRVRREIVRNPGQILIVAHSFGVLAAIQAAHDYSERIAGALLVAPADPEKFGVGDYLPAAPLPFRTVVVGSTNDSWMRLERAAHWADIWGADLVNLGAAGHINIASGFGPWPEGLALFERLRRANAADSERHDSHKHEPTPLAATALRSLANNVRVARPRAAESTSQRTLLHGHG